MPNLFKSKTIKVMLKCEKLLMIKFICLNIMLLFNNQFISKNPGIATRSRMP